MERRDITYLSLRRKRLNVYVFVSDIKNGSIRFHYDTSLLLITDGDIVIKCVYDVVKIEMLYKLASDS